LIKYVIKYVDLGLTEEIKAAEGQFKHLLNYFAVSPYMAIPCRLAGIEFKLDNHQMSTETYKELCTLCRGDSFFVEPFEQVDDVWYVKIFDIDQRCLNDIVIEKRLAVYIIYILLFLKNTVFFSVLFVSTGQNGSITN
jgi:hypothetical protein